MSELQKAKEWLKYFKQLKEANLRSYPHRTQDAEAVENCKVLLALIDSALAEPDADVAEVSNDDIDWMIAYISGGFGETWQWSKSKRNILVAALRQYQKPTDEAVSVAIWYQDSHIQKEECRWRDVSEEDDCEPGARNFHEQYIDAHKLAIQALRQTNVIQDSLQDGKRWCEKVELVEVVTDKG